MKRTFRMVIATAVTLLLSTVLSFIYFSNHSQPEKSACEHTYGEWIVERQATCKEEGLQSKTCTKCSRTVKKPIEKTNDHTEVITPAVPATCEKAGLTKGKHCSVCEKVIVPQQKIPAVAHTYSDKYDEFCNVCGSHRDAECAHKETEVIAGKAATCTEIGLTAGSKCKKCGEVLTAQSVIPVIAHSYSATVTAPTCAAEGYTTYTCKCGDTYVADRIPKTAHSFGVWTTVKEATATEEGLRERGCTKCYYTETAPIEKSHTHTYSNKYDTSCNDCGYVRDAECAHTETETLKGKAATCTETGLTAGSKCKKCGEVLSAQSVIPVIAHSYKATVTAPTCAAEGYTTYTCKCGDRYVADRIPKTAHSFGKWTTVKEATATEDGLQERACACGKKETQIIKKTGNQGSAGLEYTLSSDGKSYSVTGIGTCKDSRIVIPAKYNNLPVTAIGGYAFADCASPTSVTIPDSVTTIGDRAFFRCISLTSVTIGDGVTIIGNYAFSNCTSLVSVTIPDSVTTIGYAAFNNCTNLTGVTIGDGVTTIGDSAFYECTRLTSVTIGDGVTIIGNYAFSNCTSLVSVTIPDSVTTIGGSAFYWCTSLTSVIIPDSVTTIGSSAFLSCTSLTSVTIPDSVTTIGDETFGNCTSLTSVTIGDSVTTIGYAAFSYCTSLSNITFQGTMAQWKKIYLNIYWNYNVPATQVICSDGNTSFY